MYYCLTQNPHCTGITPCEGCYAFTRTVVIPKAMSIAGPPFNQSADHAALFMRAYHQACQEAVQAEINRQQQTVRAAAPPTPQWPTQAATPEQAAQTAQVQEREYLKQFYAHVLDQARNMSAEDRVAAATLVREGRIDGWADMGPKERAIFQYVYLRFLPREQTAPAAEEAPEDLPLESFQDGALKLAEQLKQGRVVGAVPPLEVPTPETSPAPSAPAETPPVAARGDSQETIPAGTTEGSQQG